MMCDHALEMLLEADLDELAGNGGSPLAAHVRECAKCRAVATRIAVDTRALARAFDENRVVPRPLGGRPRFALRPVVVVGAMAAALALIVFGPQRDGDLPPLAATGSTSATGPSAATGPTAATGPAASDVPAPSPARIVKPATPGARESQGTPVAPRRFAEPAPATPVRFVASQSVTVRAPALSEPGGVTVTAPEGTRVAVLRTGNPAITVVWLY